MTIVVYGVVVVNTAGMVVVVVAAAVGVGDPLDIETFGIAAVVIVAVAFPQQLWLVPLRPKRGQ